MKLRTVRVKLEIKTNAKLPDLRDLRMWQLACPNILTVEEKDLDPNVIVNRVTATVVNTTKRRQLPPKLVGMKKGT